MSQINANWFPGHMKKALNNVKNIINKCDGVIEIIDSRAPISSMPTNLEELIKDKKRFVIFSKYDLCDKEKVKKHIDYFKSQNIIPLCYNLKNKQNTKYFINELKKQKTKKDLKFTTLGFPIPSKYYIVLGIPNVGKSTLINFLSIKNKAEVENKPGKTRSEPLIKIDDKLFIYDSPGILEPRYDDKNIMLKLALLGSVKENIFPLNHLAEFSFNLMDSLYPSRLQNYYQIEASDADSFYIEVAKKRNMLLKNKLDITRSMNQVLCDIRNGIIGEICLDE